MKNTRNYVIAFLAITSLAGLVLAYRQYETIVELEARYGASGGVTKELADAQKLVRELRAQLAAAKAAHGSDVAADDAGGDGADAANADRGNRRQFRDAMRAMFNNPQFQALRAVEAKSQLDGRYAALFKQLTQNLNLTPEQLDQFKSLLVQKQQAMMDAVQAARDQGLNPRTDPDAFKAAISNAQADVDNQIKSALGDAGYAAYQQYQQTLPQRNTVSQVQQALSYSSTPLTDDQAQQLVNLMAQNSSQSTGNGGGGGRPWNGLFGGQGNQTAPITNQTVTQAASILSQSQLAALQQVQQVQQAQQQMQQLMRAAGNQARTNAGGGAAPTGGKGG